MRNDLQAIAKSLIPPALLKLVKSVRGRGNKFSGSFASWHEAQQASGGYDSGVILAKVRDALLKVKNGEAAYERDSVLFDEVQYSWPLLSALLWIASLNGNRLKLVDFGGSLGSTYFQNVKFLEHLPELRWGIVEQQAFVDCGKEYFETDRLRFFHSLDQCLADLQPDTILLCSVLPYLERPYDLLSEIVAKEFRYILVDRTPFLADGSDRLTVQKVPPEIYEASYPAWFLNEEKFLNFLAPTYELVAGFDSDVGAITLKGGNARERGFLFKRKERSEVAA